MVKKFFCNLADVILGFLMWLGNNISMLLLKIIKTIKNEFVEFKNTFFYDQYDKNVFEVISFFLSPKKVISTVRYFNMEEITHFLIGFALFLGSLVMILANKTGCIVIVNPSVLIICYIFLIVGCFNIFGAYISFDERKERMLDEIEKQQFEEHIKNVNQKKITEAYSKFLFEKDNQEQEFVTTEFELINIDY